MGGLLGWREEGLEVEGRGLSWKCQWSGEWHCLSLDGGETPGWPHFLSQGGKSWFQQLFSARDGIPPPPPRHCLETFLPQLKKGHGWHLVDRQGSRSVCRAQDKTPSQEKSGLVAKRLRKPKPEIERDPKREEGPRSDVQSGLRRASVLEVVGGFAPVFSGVAGSPGHRVGPRRVGLQEALEERKRGAVGWGPRVF